MATFVVLSPAITWTGTPIADSLITWQNATINTSAATGSYLSTAGITSRAPGLAQWSGTISGHLGTPAVGTALTASFAGGYDTNVESWNFNYTIEPNLHYTDSSTAGWMDALAGVEAWTAGLVCKLDDAEPLTAPGGAAAELVLTSSSGNTLTGDAIATAVPIPLQIGQIPTINISYEGTGTVDAAGSNNILGNGTTIGKIAPSTLTIKGHEVGTTDVQYTGTAFVTSLAIGATSAGLITYDIGFQGTGALTIADPAA